MINPNNKKPDPIDVFVGSRIRLRRNLLSISQEKLGEQLGVTFQQVQKYEKGSNRVGASRLKLIAEILGVPVSYFFDDDQKPADEIYKGFSEDRRREIDFMSSAECQTLIRAFSAIKSSKTRRKIIDLIKSVSEEDEIESQS